MPSHEYKVCLLGNSYRDKHDFAEKFAPQPKRYDETAVEEVFHRQMDVDGKQCFVDLLDVTEGLNGSKVLSHLNSNGFLLMYSAARRDELEKLPSELEHISYIREVDGVPVVLVEVAPRAAEHEERVVLKEQGEELASRFKCPFFQVDFSVPRSKAVVEEVMATLVRRIRKWERENKHKRRGKDCLVM